MIHQQLFQQLVRISNNRHKIVPVVNLSRENDKLFEQLKSGYHRTIKWNKYRSQMTIENKNNNLNYSIDPTLTKVNRLFVLSFERIAGENNTTKDHRDSFSHYYIANVFLIIT